MVKLFVVDDEEILREGLCRIKWNEIGVECIGSACNGIEALENIKQFKPDIVISDIRMPKADGIWLAQKLQNLMPAVRVIFLTGYNDFEYAQKAITFNVKEYVLKPVDADSLLEVVRKMKELVEKEELEKNRQEYFNNCVRESRYFLKDWFLNALAESKSEEEIFRKFDFFGIELDKGLVISSVIKFEHVDGNHHDNYKYFEMFEEINKILSMKNIKVISFFDGSTFTYIFSFAHEDERMARRILFELCEGMKEYLDFNYSGIYTIGVGNIVQNFRGITHSCDCALDACKYRFYLGDNQIIFIQDMEPLKRSGAYRIMVEDGYMTALKVGSEEKLMEVLNGIFEELSGNRETIDTVKRVCLELLVYTSRVIYELGQKPEMLFNNTDLWSVINRCQTVEKLYHFILDINKVVISQVFINRETTNKKLIDKVKQIITDQHAEGISLESVAEQVYLSPCYLSILFSKEAGMTFKEYLMQTRINKAKELLKEGYLKIYEVAEAVGYNDSKYFSDLFKRFTGKTPAQYKELPNG